MIERLEVGKLTGDEVESLWKKLCQDEMSFDDRTKNRVDYFLASLFNGTQYLKLGTIGLAALVNPVPGADVNVHVTFWDKSQPQVALTLIREALEYVFKEFALMRCTTCVGEYNQDALRLTKLLGFKEEGKMRKGSLFNGQFYDTVLLGLLREDFLEG
jgi:RimJ/RimL family protein N-acetyltransferase